MSLNIYIARQPIMTADESIYGYELLFRTLDPDGKIMPFFEDGLCATTRVLVNALNHFGINALVNDAKAFINIDEAFLLDDLILNIPKERFVLELLETISVTPKILDRIKELKALGYQLALDDAHCADGFMEKFSPLFPLIDILKLDVSLVDTEILKEHLNDFKKYDFEILAEKVETREQFDLYRSFGCSMFQGYFFAKPDILEKQSTDPSYTSVLKLISLLNREIEINELVSAFEEHADITVQLLRYMNSGQMMLKSEIRSIRHALTLLGKQPLKQWLMLIAYAQREGKNIPMNSPLLVLAKTRSQLMGELMQKSTNSRAKSDEAAFVGLLSLLDVVFKMPLEEIFKELHLDKDITDAVLYLNGELGELLRLTQAVEQLDLESANTLLEKFNLSPAIFEDALINSYR